MELMTKYQYSYFIYPYVIDSKKYNKYILKLLKNKNCTLRIFEKEKDMHLYNYFLPKIRDYMLWSFNLGKEGIKSLNKLDFTLKSNLLAKHECNIFSYTLPQDLAGKTEGKEGIEFSINKIKIITFKTGINFLIIKTALKENSQFSNLLNFNYKFREINSNTYSLKEYEKIKIQTDIFENIHELATLIKELTYEKDQSQEINIDNEKFWTYSYACLDQKCWNDEIENESVKNEFEKFRFMLPANTQITDSYKTDEISQINENKYIKYGFSNIGTVLLSTDVNPSNYTTVAQKYESEYLYTYIFELYKKCLLKKINNDLGNTNSFKTVEKNFLDFTKKLLVQEITNDYLGKKLIKNWNELLEIDETFQKLKNKYDIMYKKYGIEHSQKYNKVLVSVISVVSILIIASIMML